MAKFRYIYQKIVDLKSSEKSQQESILAQAVHHLSLEQQAYTALVQERQNTEQKMQQSTSNGVTLIELQHMQNYVGYIDEQLLKKMYDIERAQQIVQQKRSALVEAIKEEKIWLNAKENAKQKFLFEFEKIQQNELDEMATSRWKGVTNWQT